MQRSFALLQLRRPDHHKRHLRAVDRARPQPPEVLTPHPPRSAPDLDRHLLPAGPLPLPGQDGR
ncbi:MAG: hypothetical protein ACE5LU_11355 [Anaerolineae bacterium]